ncbi:conserved hypothetical protein [Desulfamplus magnetovallimortis]|uniref:Molybdenum carrier n=1 Tax=Desulfamplus magnetovallimortis TaxID=1246637 RepID=A0A1W1HKJ1_9BACT|nr:putative molybdenum carrier protein [Desulfamplus magnetovallimortis]SLM32973.1 conserved hypothetical protein [Desulfamplus magnetovallimortis]
MLNKIISGGQTGADRAALDIAIKFNIEHGGSVPLGRRAENGKVPLWYNLKEMDTANYSHRTSRNVQDSDGTVIVSNGKLSGGSLLTRKVAEKQGKPWCHIDLLLMDEFESAVVLDAFIKDFYIDCLNVAGSRASHDPYIYSSVKALFEVLLYMDVMERTPELISLDDMFPDKNIPEKKCSTIEEALFFLADIFSLKSRSMLANSHENDIAYYYFSMGDAIDSALGLSMGNRALIEACQKRYENMVGKIDIDDAVMIILKSFADYLRQDHVLRIVP